MILEIAGVPPFWEDRLFAEAESPVPFRIGDILLEGINPCQRCVIPSCNPHTGEIFPHFQKAYSMKRAIDARIRFISSVPDREAYLRDVRRLLGIPYAVTLAEKSNLPISWTEVETMKKSGWISFGGHTVHHPILAYLTDPSEADYEVRESRIELEHHLDTPVRSFAYPVGKAGDVGKQAVRSVQKAGYAWAVTTIDGFNTLESDPYLLHRFTVDVQQHWLIVAAKTSGAWDIFTNLVRIPMRLLHR